MGWVSANSSMAISLTCTRSPALAVWKCSRSAIFSTDSSGRVLLTTGYMSAGPKTGMAGRSEGWNRSA